MFYQRLIIRLLPALLLLLAALPAFAHDSDTAHPHSTNVGFLFAGLTIGLGLLIMGGLSLFVFLAKSGKIPLDTPTDRL